MKKILFAILAILLFAVPAHAQVVTGVITGVIGSTVACDDSSCSGFLICQNFEGTGQDNGEDWGEDDIGGTVNYDYSVAPLRGSQSLELDYNDGEIYSYITYTPSDDLYFHFLFKYSADPGLEKTLMWLYSGSLSNRQAVTLDATGHIWSAVYGWTGTPSTLAMTFGNTYRIWGHYQRATAPNTGHAWACWSETSSRTAPAGTNANYCSYTTAHDDEVQPGGIIFYNTGGSPGDKRYIDQVLVKTTAFTEVCE